MPRKSEVIQMDIQREFCSTMQELREIWDEIGIPDEQIETRGKTVLLHIRNLFQEMVSEEQNLKTNMMKKIETFLAEVDDLNEKMHLPPYTMPEGLNIMQKEKEIRMQANRLNKLKRERLCTLASLKSVEQELCDQLCTTPCYIPSTCIPSEEQLEQLVDHIETLKLEKVRRKEVFATKRTEIVDLFDELELRPETSFAQDLVTDEPDSFYLTSGKMDQLEDLRSELSIKKNEAQRLVEDLWQKVTCLWERLETPESERSNVRGECTGFKPYVVQRLQDVHTKLEHEKLIHLKSLTERCRSQIASLWDKCFYSADQRNQFIQAFDENYTVDLLDKHEEELANMHAYYEEHQEMFTNVSRWHQLFARMLELEARAHDVNRFSNRGGNLLQEERERKKIHKQLPKIEEDLFAAIDAWEEKKGVPFLVEGTRFSDYVHSQWEACERKKVNEKLMRQEKKQQELHSEMTYGSTPKTPTKRRFIGTTTILKTPTNSAKKPRNGPLDNTWKTNLTPANKTSASVYVSPGKPPISTRLRAQQMSGVKRSAKKVLGESKFNVREVKKGPGSTKSAPAGGNLDTTFIKSLSTTVVSSDKAESIKSVPLPELHTPYNEFAAEINTQAKDKRGVRSSAIGDYGHKY